MTWCHQATSHYLSLFYTSHMFIGFTLSIHPSMAVGWYVDGHLITLQEFPFTIKLMTDIIYIYIYIFAVLHDSYPDSKVHGANMGPIWGRQDPVGPHVGPMKFVIWVVSWAYWSLSLWQQLMAWQLFDATMLTSSGVHQVVHVTPWWRHQMQIFSTLLALCVGNSPVTGESLSQRPVMRTLMFSLICAWINGWVNNREAGDLRCHHAHYDVIVMLSMININSHVAAWWCHMVTQICVNIGSGIGFLAGGTTPLPGLLLIYCQCQIKSFEHISRKYG